MSYIHKPHVQPLEGRTPFQLLQAHVAAHPNKEAFVFRDLTEQRTSITFQEYESTSQFIASGLLEIGIKRKDRVLLMLPSCPEFVFFQMAVNRIGAIAIVGEEDYIPAVKSVNKVACVISKTDYHGPIGQQIVDEITSLLEEEQNVKAVLIGYQGDLPPHNRMVTYRGLLDMARKDPQSQDVLRQAEAQVSMEDPLLIMFTSGSSGAPKPIEYTNHGFVNICKLNALALHTTRDSIMFFDIPFDWLPGMLDIGIVATHGCTQIVFPPKIVLKGGFTSAVVEIIAQENCSHCSGIPYFLHDFTSIGVHDSDLTKLKYWVTGGQPLSIPTVRKLLIILPEITVLSFYGTTETGGIATQLLNKDNIDAVVPGVLDIWPGYEMKVIDPQGQLVPIGAQGELCVRAAWVSFPNPDMIKKPPKLKPISNKWHHLGDCGLLTAQGKLNLLSRMDFLIKCATESIQPEEVEDVLCQHPDIDKLCVCGVPDQRLYQKICACIVMRAGKQGDQATFDEWSSAHFAEWSVGLSYKPHYYLFLESFPLTRTGKLSRKQIQELAIQKLGLLHLN